jgi:hypothetical protein
VLGTKAGAIGALILVLWAAGWQSAVHAQEAQAPAAAGKVKATATEETQQPASSTAAPRVPSPKLLIILIRSSLCALNQANLTGDYNVLYALSSPHAQAANSPQKLAQIFAEYHKGKIDFSPVLFETPQLLRPPAVTNGQLHISGFFPTRPLRVNFDLLFDRVESHWRLAGYNVSLQQNQVEAADNPAPADPATSPAKAAAKKPVVPTD